MGSENWKIVVLKHDRASAQIAKLIGDLYPGITEVRKISNGLDRASKTTIREAIRKSVKAGKEQKVLTLYGSGGKHHYTYGLCREVADKRSEGYTYFHFDYHTDYGYTLHNGNDDILNCAEFVDVILRDSNAQALRYVGCRSSIDDGWCSVDIEKIGKTYDSDLKDQPNSKTMKKAIRRLLQNTPNDVYISMDLDVLNSDEIRTAYGNGPLSLNQLLESLDVIKTQKNIISADVLGYSTEWRRHEKSLLTYARIVEMVTGNKPRPDVLKKLDVSKKTAKRLKKG